MKNHMKDYIFQYTSLIILGAVFLAFSIFYYFSYQALESLTKDTLIKDLTQRSIIIENDLKRKIRMLEYAAAKPILLDDSVTYSQKFGEILHNIDIADFSSISIIDSEGIAHTSQNTTFSVKEQQFYKNAFDKKTAVGYTKQNQKSKNVSATISVQIATPSDPDRCVGFLTATLNSSWLSHLFKEDAQSYDLIVDKSRVIVSSYNEKSSNNKTPIKYENDFFVLMPSVEFNDPRNSYKDFKSGIYYFVYENVKMVAVFSEIRSTDWFLVTIGNEAYFFSRMNNLLFNIFALLLVTLISLGVLLKYYGQLAKELNKEARKSLMAVNLARLFVLEISSSGKIKNANSNFFLTTGFKESEIINEDFKQLLSEKYIPIFQKFLSTVKEKEHVLDLDIPIISKNGTIIYVLWGASHISSQSQETTIEFIGTNITSLREYQNKIHKLAYFDSITDLPNRASLKDTVAQMFSSDEPFALMLVNIDNFKMINDSFGFSMGNKFIKHVGDCINEDISEKELVFKLSGDEFAVIYKNYYDYGEVGEYADFVFNKVTKEFSDEEEDVKIKSTCSVGIGIARDHGKNFDDLYKAADIALGKSKAMGKARVTYFAQRMNDELVKLFTLDVDLKKAVQNKEFILYYQPQYDMQTGSLYGFEALIRWISPDRGFVNPGAFISAAEKNKLIIPIGNWALEEACNFAKEVVALGYEDICISVNASVVQIEEENFVPTILNIIKKSGVDFKNIKLEITESVMMENLDINLMKIKELVDEGIKIALDDFGTGYSSLTYLKRIPIQLLKIDKSFVDTILDGDENKEIITSIIGLAHNIKVQVVAEGVEEFVQLAWLKERGCNICQGYYSGRPVPKEKAIECLPNNIYNLGHC